jgi:predicted helicase
MERGDNIALVATRQVTRPQFEHVFVSRDIIEIKMCSHDRNTQIFPLFVNTADGELGLVSKTIANLDTAVQTKLSTVLGLPLRMEARTLGKDSELTPLQIFSYIYAVLHSPTYRDRYFAFLRSDFPRLPLVGNLDLFRALVRRGHELVAFHLMEAPQLDHHLTKLIGVVQPKVVKISYANKTVWLNDDRSSGFQGVPDAVWNFYIGGYRVCEKWLKDRKDRKLLKDDIDHYQRIVVALAETIRLMKEIDGVIDKHGGWPDAFSAGSPESAETTGTRV